MVCVVRLMDNWQFLFVLIWWNSLFILVLGRMIGSKLFLKLLLKKMLVQFGVIIVWKLYLFSVQGVCLWDELQLKFFCVSSMLVFWQCGWLRMKFGFSGCFELFCFGCLIFRQCYLLNRLGLKLVCLIDLRNCLGMI